ncbi:MAG: DUF4416 family protein [Thermoguttaceae bacterium]|jgi:hypothetical protein
MGQPTIHSPAMFLLAAFSRYDEALQWGKKQAEEKWGTIELESPAFEFSETEYYTSTMGPGLKKVFFGFQQPFDPADLVDVKLLTNAWEDEYAALARHPEPRPLNLDPGYITLGKLILASTKDFAYRIYLNRGIYAEVTLFYKHHRWQHHDCTFADYRREDYQRFFSLCRESLHQRLRKEND